jgi:hypothetical protein
MLKMSPAGQFGNHTTVFLVYLLASNDIRFNHSIYTNGHSGFVAGRFYGKYRWQG